MQRYAKKASKLHEKVELYINKEELLSPGAKVIVAISGGADSVALLHILLALGYRCIAAHCNFNLRREESERDEQFVRNFCLSLNVKTYHTDFKTIEYSKNRGISIEMAARELRYAWFEQLAEKEQAAAIAVGHHADDNAETLLMHLVRGSGLKGLTGIPPRNKKIVRPLLSCSRQEILHYLKEHNLNFVVDSSNLTCDYQRNKLRNAVIPLMQEINPSLGETFQQSIAYFRGAYALYAEAIEQIKKKICTEENRLLKIDIALLKQQKAIPTVLYELLHPYGFNPATVAKIAASIDKETGKQFFSTTGYRLTKDRSQLIIDEPSGKTESRWIDESEHSVCGSPNLQIKRIKRTEDFLFSRENHRVHIDASKLQFPLELRPWQAGDFFYPIGMKQKKKLSDFLTDIKLSRPEKDETQVLVSQGNIVWVVGHRLDERFKISDRTEEIIEITVQTDI